MVLRKKSPPAQIFNSPHSPLPKYASFHYKEQFLFRYLLKHLNLSNSREKVKGEKDTRVAQLEVMLQERQSGCLDYYKCTGWRRHGSGKIHKDPAEDKGKKGWLRMAAMGKKKQIKDNLYLQGAISPSAGLSRILPFMT